MKAITNGTSSSEVEGKKKEGDSGSERVRFIARAQSRPSTLALVTDVRTAKKVDADDDDAYHLSFHPCTAAADAILEAAMDTSSIFGSLQKAPACLCRRSLEAERSDSENIIRDDLSHRMLSRCVTESHQRDFDQVI